MGWNRNIRSAWARASSVTAASDGQAGSGHSEGKAHLVRPVQSEKEGVEAGGGQVVHFVDREEDARVVGPGRPAHLFEEVGEVAPQIPRVGDARDRLRLALKGARHGVGRGEGLENAECPPVHALGLLLPP